MLLVVVKIDYQIPMSTSSVEMIIVSLIAIGMITLEMEMDTSMQMEIM